VSYAYLAVGLPLNEILAELWGQDIAAIVDDEDSIEEKLENVGLKRLGDIYGLSIDYVDDDNYDYVYSSEIKVSEVTSKIEQVALTLRDLGCGAPPKLFLTH